MLALLLLFGLQDRSRLAQESGRISPGGGIVVAEDLHAEVINLLNSKNHRFDSFNGYNARTGRASITLDTMFPVIPSAGIALEFGGRPW